MSFCVLHIGDDPLIRDAVELSLGLDPTFTVMSCTGGDDALAIAADRSPDLILCDVMMPGMDGPATLMRLRENASTSKVPVVIMTASTQASELEQMESIGAAAVMTKPFDPEKLADMVRGHLRFAKLATLSHDFVQRLHTDAAKLAIFRDKLRSQSDSAVVPEGLQTCVHKLAGAAGVFDYHAVSCAASTLEDAIIERCAGRGTPGRLKADLDALVECIERE
jgi:two-component system OmpR family response regulator